MDEYKKELQDRLDSARKLASDGIAAGNFSKTSEGQLIQEWINERVTKLLDDMTSRQPLSDREYLAAHGAIRELKDFNLMLQSKVRAGKSAEAEMVILNEQQRAITPPGDTPAS